MINPNEVLRQAHGRDPAWLLLTALLTMFTVYTSVRLAEQLVTERGASRAAWLAGSASIAGFARFAVQLCLLRLVHGSGDLSCDLPWLLVALLFSVMGRLLALDGATRPSIRLRRLLPAGMAEGSTVLLTQLALFRAAHTWYALPMLDIAILLVLAGFSCVVALTAAIRIIHKPAGAWPGERFVYYASPLLGVLALSFAGGVIGNLRAVYRHQLPVVPGSMQLSATALDALILFAGIMLCISNGWLFVYRRAARFSRDLKQAEEQRAVAAALADQRVVRLQNELLLEEIRERKKIEAKLAHSAFHDSVTGLHNRAHLMEALRGRLNRKQPRGLSAGTLLYIDLDNFKAINDMLGHTHGDRVVVEAASRMQRCLRDTDVLARMGGDEFAVLLCSTTDDGRALRLARHMLTVLEESMQVAATSFNLSASIGLCTIDSSYTVAEDVLRDADLAMYQAKRQGGARVVRYEPYMHAEAVEAMHARAELKRAIENEEFVLWYQPLVDMRDGSIYGMEALIRWQHPQKGLVGPGTFIPLAEETGHIVEIGNWVLRRACEDYARLRRHSSRSLLLSLNVTPRQLELSGFMELLLKVIDDTRIPPECLQLEITESVLLGDPARMGRIFQQIRSLGIRIAFDDFGTGYSSLSYVQRYPVDTLKIDQSFVRHLADGAVNADIILFIIGLAQVLRMNVSAEGVETQEEAGVLLKLGCQIAQGYLYSKPVPLHDFIALFDRPSLIPAKKPRTLSPAPPAQMSNATTATATQ